MATARFKQIGIYLGKNFRLFKNEKGWKSLIFCGVISLLVSMVLSRNVFHFTMETWTGFFTIVSACIWIGIFNSIQTICKERPIIKREHRTGLHISSYVIAHVLYQALLCLAEAVIVLVITAIFLQYPAYSLLGSVYIECLITYFLILLAADGLGLLISSVVKTPMTAMTVMPFILIVQLVFSGALFTLSGPLQNISAVTLTRWGLNATCISADYNSLQNTEIVKLEDTVYDILQENDLPVTENTVDHVVETYYKTEPKPEYTYTLSNLATQWGVLLLHFVIYIAGSILALEFIDKDKR